MRGGRLLHCFALVLVLASSCRVEPTVGRLLDAAVADATPDATRASFVVTAGGPGADVARSIALDAAGNIFIAGSYSGTAQFGAHALTATHAHESFVAKLDPSGSFSWVVSVGGTAKQKPQAVAVDTSGDVHIVASFAGTSQLGHASLSATGSADLVVAKIDGAGRVVRATAAARGSVDLEDGVGIAVDGAGAVTITGGFSQSASFGDHTVTSKGGADVFVARLDPSGRFSSAASAGGDGRDQANAVVVDAAGGAFVVGAFSGVAQFGSKTLDAGKTKNPLQPWRSGCFVTRVEAAREFVWAKPVASAPDSTCTSIALAGGLLVVGTTYELGFVGTARPFAARLDLAGGITWVASEAFAPRDELAPTRGNAVALDADGNGIIVGVIAPTTNVLASDVFLSRLDRTGEMTLIAVGGGPGDDLGLAIAVDPKRSLYVAGSFSGAAQLGRTSVSAAGSDAFVWKARLP